MPTRIALIFFTFILALVSLAGCGGAQSPSAPALPSAADAQNAICTSLAAVNSGVDKLANINRRFDQVLIHVDSILSSESGRIAPGFALCAPDNPRKSDTRVWLDGEPLG